jgi:acetamidase/formamidase
MSLPTPSVHVARDQNHLAWDPAIPPVASVGSGEVVEFDCLDASFGQLTADSTNDDLARLDFSRVDQVNGPAAPRIGQDVVVALPELECGP